MREECRVLEMVFELAGGVAFFLGSGFQTRLHVHSWFYLDVRLETG